LGNGIRAGNPKGATHSRPDPDPRNQRRKRLQHIPDFSQLFKQVRDRHIFKPQAQQAKPNPQGARAPKDAGAGFGKLNGPANVSPNGPGASAGRGRTRRQESRADRHRHKTHPQTDWGIDLGLGRMPNRGQRPSLKKLLIMGSLGRSAQASLPLLNSSIPNLSPPRKAQLSYNRSKLKARLPVGKQEVRSSSLRLQSD